MIRIINMKTHQMYMPEGDGYIPVHKARGISIGSLFIGVLHHGDDWTFTVCSVEPLENTDGK